MRVLAAVISSARVLFGIAFIAKPTIMEPAWIGKQARVPGAQLLARAVGARDLVVGLGGLHALTREDRLVRPWVAAGGICDAVDFGATWAAGRMIPRDARRGVLVVASASSLLSAVAVARLGASGQPQPSEPVGTT